MSTDQGEHEEKVWNMPLAGLDIREVREILHFKLGLKRSKQEIRHALGVSTAMVSACLKLFEASGLEWSQVKFLPINEFERRLDGD